MLGFSVLDIQCTLTMIMHVIMAGLIAWLMQRHVPTLTVNGKFPWIHQNAKGTPDVEKCPTIDIETYTDKPDESTKPQTSHWLNCITSFACQLIFEGQSNILCKALNSHINQSLEKMSTRNSILAPVQRSRSIIGCKGKVNIEGKLWASRFGRFVSDHEKPSHIKIIGQGGAHQSVQTQTVRFISHLEKPKVQQFGVTFHEIKTGASFPRLLSVQKTELCSDHTLIKKSLEGRNHGILGDRSFSAFTLQLEYLTDDNFSIHAAIRIPIENTCTVPFSFRVTNLKIRATGTFAIIPCEQSMLLPITVDEPMELDFSLESTIGHHHLLKDNPKVEKLIRHSISRLVRDNLQNTFVYEYS